jgi:S-DNA-T family DNA segregation ATPase FtsK/SpoIIIE
MPTKKKSKNTKPQPKKKAPARNGSFWGRFFRFLVSAPVRRIIMVVVIIALMAIFWGGISSAYSDLVRLFGWGLVFILGAFITLVVLVWRRRLDTLARYWNYWLGGVAFVFAVWGVMGLVNDDIGGRFGLGIVGGPGPTIGGTVSGILFVVLYIILGVVLVAPRQSYGAVRNLFLWVERKIRGQPAPARQPALTATPRRGLRLTPPISGKPPLPRVMDEPAMPPEVASSRKRLEDLAEKAAALKPGAAPSPSEESPSRPDLRQVADDVWKKYGQSPNLVVVEGWRLPPLEILDRSPEVQFSEADNLQRAKLIEETLASYGVDSKVVQINAGPTVTQFGVEPGWDRKLREVKEKDRDGNVQVHLEEVSKTRVKVERINSLSNDLSLALAAPTIRIEAPVPGKTFVGVEVPNTTSDMVSLRGVVETSVFQKLLGKTKMAMALGKGAGGETVAADLTKMPHLLIAGATGSGKTVCLNTIVCCLLMHNTPNDVRFILIDPKRVELTQYNSIPHLATPVIVETTRALGALRWLSQEMDQRYQKLAAAGARHIEGYNKNKTAADRLPYLVLIIDELADLMMAGFDEVEANLCRLAQLARATGIHLVVATQRPSVDVVTGLIKANFPTRISFAVTSQVDSRTILDGAGAEKLLGKGDMLYMPTEAAKPKRLQGCFLSDPEIERLVYFWGSQAPKEPDKLKMEALVATTPSGTIGGHQRDPLLEQAKELAREHNDVSTSFLQRRLHIGYPRAARLKEQLDAVLAAEVGEHLNEESIGESGEDPLSLA